MKRGGFKRRTGARVLALLVMAVLVLGLAAPAGASSRGFDLGMLQELLQVVGSDTGSSSGSSSGSSGSASGSLEDTGSYLDLFMDMLGGEGSRKIKDCDVEAIADQTYTGKAIRPSVKITWNGTKLTRSTDYTLTYSNNTKVGTAKVKITGKGKYTGTKTVSFKIVKKDSGKTSGKSSGSSSSSAEKTGTFRITLSKDSYVYDGKVHKPTVKVKAGSKSVSSSDYTVSYEDHKNVGKATVTVKGKGEYKGYTGTATFRITMKKTSLSGLTAGESGTLKASWRKDSQADGYQVQYGTRKDFSGTVKTKKLGAGSLSVTLDKLTSGKKYYVRIRAYKKVGGTNWYSDWSAAKQAAVK